MAVSILILLEVILEARYFSCFHLHFQVSILILLEVILEVIHRPTNAISLLSFNPYFTGSNSGRCGARLLTLLFKSFNPYFTGSNSGSAFCSERLNKPVIVSILILLEVILEAFQNLPLFVPELVSILILLEVILEAGSGSTLIAAENRFNPYFTGSNSGSNPTKEYELGVKKFQSLFYWK